MKRVTILSITMVFFLVFSAPLWAKSKNSTAVEAGKVSISINEDGASGTVSVQQCNSCPMMLGFDSETKFKVKGKKTYVKAAARSNGRPGTVIYDREGKRVLKVIW